VTLGGFEGKRFDLAKKKMTKNRSQSASKSAMDLQLLERIVKLMNDGGLNTLEVRDGEKRIVMKRGQEFAVGAHTHFVGGAPSHGHSAHSPPAAPTLSAQTAESTAGSDSEAGLVTIKSPMVGTFYAATSPDAKPLVSVGSVVDEETDVCIIEAMKVFNNIKAETRGTIVKVLVANGQTVEFGTPLFLVKS
jgi:acetyl-CoA carboxylase biotin carboxyl carrier protein